MKLFCYPLKSLTMLKNKFLNKKIKMAKKNSNNINVQMFTQLKVAEKSKVPVFFIGAVGAGKTTSVYMFAKVRGYEVVLL